MASGDREAFAKLAASMLLTMRGSVCLYQGEELGLTEGGAGLRGSGRPLRHRVLASSSRAATGCRTPMVWQGAAHLGGFLDGAAGPGRRCRATIC